MLVLEEEEWGKATKTEHYLAQISADIRRISQMFADEPRQVTTEDCLIKFQRQDGSPAGLSGGASAPVKGGGGIEVGPEAVKDPKWAKVNLNAKMAWAARLLSQGISQEEVDRWYKGQVPPQPVS